MTLEQHGHVMHMCGWSSYPCILEVVDIPAIAPSCPVLVGASPRRMLAMGIFRAREMCHKCL